MPKSPNEIPRYAQRPDAPRRRKTMAELRRTRNSEDTSASPESQNSVGVISETSGKDDNEMCESFDSKPAGCEDESCAGDLIEEPLKETPKDSSLPVKRIETSTHENQSSTPITSAIMPHSLPTIPIKLLCLSLTTIIISASALYLRNQQKYCESFQELSKQYPNIDRMLWITLDVGVKRALLDHPGEPSTYMLLDSSGSITNSSLIKDIVSRLAMCFDNTEPVELESDYFFDEKLRRDHFEFLRRHKEEIERKGLLVVHNLDLIPAQVARAFFSICDSYEPVIRRAIVLFTINVSKNKTEAIMEEGENRIDDTTPTQEAESLLRDHWGELNGNMLDPLLVRLTENVYRTN